MIKHEWKLLKLSNAGNQQQFLFNGIGCNVFNEKAIIIKEDFYACKYLNPLWWVKNNYQRKDLNDNTSDLYYLHNGKFNVRIIDVMNKKITFDEYLIKRHTEFFNQNPILLTNSFSILLDKLNNFYKLKLFLNTKKISYESCIYVNDHNNNDELILTWKNSY